MPRTLDFAAADLTTLDALVERALRAGSSSGLPVIGFGEISTVLAWPPGDPRWAVKRLPPFAPGGQLETYRADVGAYVAELRRRGVAVVPTQVVETGATSSQRRAFIVQPLSQPAQLLSAQLAGAEAGSPAARRWLQTLVELVSRCVDERVGLDAQVSNWALGPDGLHYLDVSTPFHRDEVGCDRLDLTLVLSVYPAVLRPALARWVVPGIAAAYHDADSVLLDVAGNLCREGLERHLPALTAAAATRNVVLDPDAIQRRFQQDTRTWKVLRALRRADRLWQRQVRRRPYPFLLPEDDHA